LKEGNILRFGRMRFKVQEIFFQQLAPKNTMNEKKAWKISRSIPSKSLNFSDRNSKSPINDASKTIVMDEDEKPNSVICKFCLSEALDTENPFVNPCSCAGSLKYSHLKCLQLWLNSQVQEKKINENCVNYSWKSFSCELCKHDIPCTNIFFFNIILKKKTIV
jgi:hypothetical protein